MTGEGKGADRDGRGGCSSEGGLPAGRTSYPEPNLLRLHWPLTGLGRGKCPVQPPPQPPCPFKGEGDPRNTVKGTVRGTKGLTTHLKDTSLPSAHHITDGLLTAAPLTRTSHRAVIKTKQQNHKTYLKVERTTGRHRQASEPKKLQLGSQEFKTSMITTVRALMDKVDSM